jgi:hypothetical protein
MNMNKKTMLNEFAIRIVLAAVSLLFFVVPAAAQGTAKLAPETVKGFDQFVASSEESMANRQSG